MNFVSPIPRSGTAQFRETSSLITSREADLIGRQHLASQTNEQQLRTLANNVAQQGREIQKMRKRKIIASPSIEHFRGEYDVGAVDNFYGTLDEVIVSTGAASRVAGSRSMPDCQANMFRPC